MDAPKFTIRRLGEENQTLEESKDDKLTTSYAPGDTESEIDYELELSLESPGKSIEGNDSTQDSPESRSIRGPRVKTKLQLKKKEPVVLEGNLCPECNAKVKKNASSCGSCGQQFVSQNKTKADFSSTPIFHRRTNYENNKIRYEGINRITYFILNIIIVPLVLMGQIKTKDNSLPLFVLITVGFVIIKLFLGAKRLQNTGTSGVFIFTSLIPLVNLWTFYRLYICQSGYSNNDHKLDFWGKLLALPFLLIVIAAVSRIFR